nr:hypothetical protein [Clostridia bacterium]
FLTKVFAELFSKSDRIPPRHTNNPELAKSRKFSSLTTPYAAFFPTVSNTAVKTLTYDIDICMVL